MRAPFWLKLALREARASARRLGVYMGAITLGVAALVAVNSFRAQVVESVDTESKALLGADLRLQSSRAFPDSVLAILDSAAAAGVPVSRVTITLSVALAPDGTPRLVQVRAVEGGYPYYGEMTTEPPGEWARLATGRGALVEPAVIEQLGVQPGDSLRLGMAWFEVRGALTALPPDMSFRNALGPRVFIHASQLEATELLQFGSLAQYEAFLYIPDNAELQRFIDTNRETLRAAAVGIDSAAEQAENLARALEVLGRFLGLVGLSALLLGGLGVASAVNVFVKDKRRTVAVLRCLGATQRTAFGAYMLQATLLGVCGAALGALLGVGIQALLPSLVGDLIPVDVPFAVQWSVVGIGVAIGALVAATFSLLPLLAVRGISPLRALRHDVDDTAGRRVDAWRVLAFLLIVGSVVAVAIWQARIWQIGLAYAAALVVGMLVLWLAARLLVMLTRRLARGGFALARREHSGGGRRRVFPARQGISNLYRPRNQTTAVTMALGFGVFLVATLWVVQTNLLGWLRGDASAPVPNLVLFDIQLDQRDELRAVLEPFADRAPVLVPIVPGRIATINDEEASALLQRGRTPRVEPWAVRREYRHTYRDHLTGGETLVRGEWFGATPAAAAPRNARRAPATTEAAPEAAPEAQPAEDRITDAVAAGAIRVSAEQDVARSLGVGIGDRITWDFAGVRVESVITSLREVDWARFETNFFFVFEPGALEHAPQTLVSLVSVASDTARTAAQRAVAERFANISIVDLDNVQRMLRRIIDRVVYAIRFMAAFSVGAGALVLFGAIAASRFQRVRESALLRALGATRAQVRTIMLVEYAALGALAALAGTLLAAVAGWLLMTRVFNMAYSLPVLQLTLICLGVTALAALLGMMNSREALRSTPLVALREAES